MNAVDALFAALHGIPRLPGALCRGQHQLFDDADLPDEALAICTRCPALASCSAWFEALPPRHRPRGVIAGRVHKPKDAA
jgi:WhiB family redox-sensing transcriptional regulator